MVAAEAVVDSEADVEAVVVVDLVEDAAAVAVVEAVTLENKPTSKDDQETGSVPPNAATQISPGATSATSVASPSLKAPVVAVAAAAAATAEGVVAVEALATAVVVAAAVVAALATAVVVAADLEVAAAVLVTVEAADPCGVAAGAEEIDTALTERITTFPLHSSNTSSSQIIYSLLRFNTGVQKRPLLFRKKGLLPSPQGIPLNKP